MLGLADKNLKFVPHNSNWKTLFSREKERIQATLGDKILDIQHIGSTAIPGLIAKPILDLAIAVENFEAATVCIQPLELLGYQYKGEFGIPRRHYFVKGNPRTHNLHMWEIDSWDWHRHLRFRDYLIQHPEVVQQYAKLKQQLLQQSQGDREAYQLGKAEFIEQIERQN